MKHIIAKAFLTFSIFVTVFLVIVLPGVTKVFGLAILPASFFTGVYLLGIISVMSALGWEYADKNASRFSWPFGEKKLHADLKEALEASEKQ